MADSDSLVKYDAPKCITTRSPKKDGNSQNEDILNQIIPPKEWENNGNKWVQSVSSTPATRLDVINLQAKLDDKLLQLQARETGICPIREELYSQCFDELIRQVTINCAERGLLLLRVRDEIRMTIQSYQTLYESSVAHGLRKALSAEKDRQDIQNKIKDIETSNKSLKVRVEELNAEIEEQEEMERQKRKEAVEKNEEEIKLLKNQVDGLKEELEKVLGLPKSKVKKSK